MCVRLVLRLISRRRGNQGRMSARLIGKPAIKEETTEKTDDEFGCPLQAEIEVFVEKIAEGCSAKVLEFLQDLTRDQIKSSLGKSGLKVGETAPIFSLPDQNGNMVHLPDLLQAGKTLVLQFYRGACCPCCDLQMDSNQHQEHMNALLRSAPGVRVVAISSDTTKYITLPTSHRRRVEYSILTDLQDTVAHKFNLVLNLEEQLRPILELWGFDIPPMQESGMASYMLPIPATYILNSDGRIMFRSIHAGYTGSEDVTRVIRKLRS